MSPRSLADEVVRPVAPLGPDVPVADALARLLAEDLPALPVVAPGGELVGIFGEREFLAALFPAYVGQLTGAAFVSRSIDDQLDRRAGSLREPVQRHVTRDHVDVDAEVADLQLAEIFLHHRVLVVPVRRADGGWALVTRRDFFRAVAARAAGP